MAQKRRIGLVFANDERWIGQTYYILNLINSLNTLKEPDQPVIVVLTIKVEDFEMVRETTKYPFLEYRNYYQNSKGERIINKICRMVGLPQIFEKRPDEKEISVVFPANGLYYFDLIPNKIHWIPDFQDKYLPQFFTQQEIATRKAHHGFLASKKENIVFSSLDAEKDFKNFYPNANAKTHVLNFAVTHPDFKDLNFDSLKIKFNITDPYFFCPNQFWIHKNQIVILKAVKILRDKGIGVNVVFTGKEHDHRSPDYFSSLKKFVDESGIEKNIRFLGFIDRSEQLKLMKESLAVIQPSLFEGWSTVIEDAKAMNKFVLASDLKVHKEQLKSNVVFFNPLNDLELANELENYLSKPRYEESLDYLENIRNFALKFLSIVDTSSVKL